MCCISRPTLSTTQRTFAPSAREDAASCTRQTASSEREKEQESRGPREERAFDWFERMRLISAHVSSLSVCMCRRRTLQ